MDPGSCQVWIGSRASRLHMERIFPLLHRTRTLVFFLLNAFRGSSSPKNSPGQQPTQPIAPKPFTPPLPPASHSKSQHHQPICNSSPNARSFFPSGGNLFLSPSSALPDSFFHIHLSHHLAHKGLLANSSQVSVFCALIVPSRDFHCDIHHCLCFLLFMVCPSSHCISMH